jgi:phenylpropionate dioxygenase-like ring-hydroxylating dioxygenase large terminal subunit
MRGADDGVVRVFHNRCRHRGALLSQMDLGNSSFIRCSYHGWTYDSTGALVGLPLPKRYVDGPKKEERSLDVLARVESYRGFIFASASPGGVDLDEHLGNAKPYLDRIAAHAAGISVGPVSQRVEYDGNWKLQLENVIDNYHVTITHKSFIDILTARTGTRGSWNSGSARSLGNGHGTIEFPIDTGAATGGEAFNLVVFPNLAFVGYQIRVIQPVRVDHSRVTLQPILLKEVAPEVNSARLRSHEESFGPSGFVSPDDVEVALNRMQSGVATGGHWMDLRRGLGAEERGPNGILTGDITDETAHRGMWREWKRLMAGVPLGNGGQRA